MFCETVCWVILGSTWAAVGEEEGDIVTIVIFSSVLNMFLRRFWLLFGRIDRQCAFCTLIFYLGWVL